MGKVMRAFCWHQKFVPKELSALYPGLYTYIKFKMCIKSNFIFFFKLATNGQSDKGFLLTSEVCPQGVVCPCPRAIYMYKIIKNVYKIRFWQGRFETCNIWAKRKGLPVVIKSLSPICCLPLSWAIYMWKKHEKGCIKSDFKVIVLKLAANGQIDKGFLLTSTFVPGGLSAPALGLYTCIKSIKIYTRTRCQVSVYRTTGDLVCFYSTKDTKLSCLYHRCLARCFARKVVEYV